MFIRKHTVNTVGKKPGEGKRPDGDLIVLPFNNSSSAPHFIAKRMRFSCPSLAESNHPDCLCHAFLNILSWIVDISILIHYF